MMKRARLLAVVFLGLVTVSSVLASVLAPAHYSHQFRDDPDAACSWHHPLGTDDLGRDRFSRLLYGTRVSLFLAPAAALISTILAALIGGIAVFSNKWAEQAVMSVTDLFLSLPWLFLVITIRALLPLNVAPLTSVIITFALLGSLGWAGAARVVCADTRRLCESDFMLHARASGFTGFRLLWRHLLPNLRPVLLAQFWISIPVFILSETNLSILGLGVAEPLPSWGSLLRELEGFSLLSARPWQFASLILLVATVSCFHVAMQSEEA
ncbi:ABC transporter permease [Acidobacteria bacterium AB60]|nr:ABC transporter permease [Acidobacteria bacterium AB60]